MVDQTAREKILEAFHALENRLLLEKKPCDLGTKKIFMDYAWHQFDVQVVLEVLLTTDESITGH